MGWLKPLPMTLSFCIKSHIWGWFSLLEAHGPFCLSNLLQSCEALSCSVVSEIFIANHVLDFRTKIGSRVHKMVFTWITAWLNSSGGVPSTCSGGRGVFVKVVCRCAYRCRNELIFIYVVCWLLSCRPLSIAIVGWALFGVYLILEHKEVSCLRMRNPIFENVRVLGSASIWMSHHKLLD